MATDVSICNSALIKLGAERITALTDDSKEAQLCNEQYEKIRDKLLFSHPWNFATKRVELTANGNTSVYDDLNEFDLPADYLRIYEQEDVQRQWFIEDSGSGKKLYADDDPVAFRYIFKNTDPSTYSPGFVELLSLALAKDLAYSLVQSATLKQTLLAEYESMLRDVRSFDSQEGIPGRVDSNYWIGVRQ